MPEFVRQVEFEIVRGEDWSVQIFWTDEYDEPVPVSEPVLMDVKDSTGQIAMRFTTSTDSESAPHVTMSGTLGFLQLTVPRSVTALLVPGRYVCDMFAAVADTTGPFVRQAQQLFVGTVLVHNRLSDITDPDIEAGLLAGEEVVA